MTVSDGLNASSVVVTHPDETMPTSGDASWLTDPRVKKRREEDAEVRQYLLDIDKLRQECEKKKNFSKAQECVDRIRETNLRYAKKLEVDARRVDVGWRQRTLEHQRLELLTFHEMWEAKMHDYDAQADALRRASDARQAAALQSREELWRLELLSERPRPSGALLDRRRAQRLLVEQRRYDEAERAEREIARLEADERRAHEAAGERRLRERLEAEAERMRAERAAVEQRLALNRDQLLAERRGDFEVVTKRHAATMRAREQSATRVVSRTNECVRRQLHALEKDPIKVGLDLVQLSEVLLNGGEGESDSGLGKRGSKTGGWKNTTDVSPKKRRGRSVRRWRSPPSQRSRSSSSKPPWRP